MRWTTSVLALLFFALATSAMANLTPPTGPQPHTYTKPGRAALRTYSKLWQRASRFYGAQGQPAPVFRRMEAGDVGVMHTDKDGPVPIVAAKPFAMRALAGKGPGNRAGVGGPGIRKNIDKRWDEKILLNEWAKVYQRPEVWNNWQESEARAGQFANALAKRIIARPGKRMKLPLDRSQFGP